MDYILGIGYALAMAIGNISFFNTLALSFSTCLLTCRSSPFLCLYAAQVWLRGDIMDATPFVTLTLEKMISLGPGTPVDPPLAPTVRGLCCHPAPPSDHWYGGLGVSLGDSEAWKPQKVLGFGPI